MGLEERARYRRRLWWRRAGHVALTVAGVAGWIAVGALSGWSAV